MNICKLPDGEWLNLDAIRRVQVEQDVLAPLVVVEWFDGDNQIYRGEQATALIAGWERAYTSQLAGYPP